MKVAKLAIESQMTNPPRPTNFGVIVDGNPVAILEVQVVKDALARYEAMMAAYEAQRRIT